MKHPLKARLLAVAGLLAATSIGLAQIERLDLAQMMAKCDGAMVGKIVKNEVFRTDVPTPEMYFTRLTIQGRDLVKGEAKTIEVVYPGGFISRNEGSFNSEAPHADDVKVGNEVVIFHRFEENIGNDVSGHSIYAWHGGLYRVMDTARNGKVVLGRGEGYAISANRKLDDLDKDVTRLFEEGRK